MKDSSLLDQRCKKLKMQNTEAEVVRQLGMLSLVPGKDAPPPAPKKPELFESPEKNVFLIKKINREDLRRRFRDSEVGDSMRERRRDFLRSKGITYFDQKENTTKRMAMDELENGQIENGIFALNRIC